MKFHDRGHKPRQGRSTVGITTSTAIFPYLNACGQAPHPPAELSSCTTRCSHQKQKILLRSSIISIVLFKKIRTSPKRAAVLLALLKFLFFRSKSCLQSRFLLTGLYFSSLTLRRWHRVFRSSPKVKRKSGLRCRSVCTPDLPSLDFESPCHMCAF